MNEIECEQDRKKGKPYVSKCEKRALARDPACKYSKDRCSSEKDKKKTDKKDEKKTEKKDEEKTDKKDEKKTEKKDVDALKDKLVKQVIDGRDTSTNKLSCKIAAIIRDTKIKSSKPKVVDVE